jgi:hypothetical protein
VTAERFVRS